MKHFLSQTYFNNTLEDWLTAVIIIALSITLARVGYWIFTIALKQVTKRTKTPLDDLVVDRIKRPVLMLIVLIGIRSALETLHFTERIDLWVQRGFIFVITINVTWFFITMLETVLESYLVPYSKREGSRLDDQMLMVIRRVVRSLVWAIGIVAALNNAGFDVGALLAGLGIGGLAIALAAQDTMKNIFGGFIIFTDRPFRIGDQVRIDQIEGVVENIGIRSTRLRLLNGRLVTIPNLQFSDRPIENISNEPERRINLVLGLTYSTPPEKIELAIKLVKNIAQANKHLVDSEKTIVFLEKFNASSLDINIFYFIQKGQNLAEVQTTMNLQILKAFNEHGLEFAFPTQTVYQTNMNAGDRD